MIYTNNKPRIEKIRAVTRDAIHDDAKKHECVLSLTSDRFEEEENNAMNIFENCKTNIKMNS